MIKILVGIVNWTRNQFTRTTTKKKQELIFKMKMYQCFVKLIINNILCLIIIEVPKGNIALEFFEGFCGGRAKKLVM